MGVLACPGPPWSDSVHSSLMGENLWWIVNSGCGISKFVLASEGRGDMIRPEPSYQGLLEILGWGGVCTPT